MSEEEKDAIAFSKFIQRKRLMRMGKTSKQRGGGMGTPGFNSGLDAYLELIKKNFDMIYQKEEESR